MNNSDAADAEASPSKPYTLVQDAYDPLFPSLPTAPSPAASTSTTPPTSFQPSPTARLTTQRRQNQKLTPDEAQVFADLIGQIIPQSSTGTGIFDAYTSLRPSTSTSGGKVTAGLDRVRMALEQKVGARVAGKERKARSSLTVEEEEELDTMREKMLSFRTDLDLLEWSLSNIFHFRTPPPSATLFPDPRTIASHPKRGTTHRLYPDLLLLLFLLLRDTHLAPHSALHVFALASTSPQSYVQGCTTALYNEVLRTKWALGDIEGVKEGLEEMRSGGVRIDEGTRAIVIEIGAAIRTDLNRAESRTALVLGRPASEVEDEEVEVGRRKVLGSAEVGSWARMEWILEEQSDERMETEEKKKDEKRREWEERIESREREERRTAEAERPSLFMRGNDPESGISRVPLSSSTSSYGRDDPVTSTDFDNGVERSWQGFPTDPTKSTYHRSNEGRSMARFDGGDLRDEPRSDGERRLRNSREEDYERDESGYRPSTRRDYDPERYDRNEEFGDDEEGMEDRRRYGYSRPIAREQISSEARLAKEVALKAQAARRELSAREADDEDEMAPVGDAARGRRESDDNLIVLPRRPSFANPFKIRRKGLTKDEKSRHDTPHPMMFWKKK